MKKTPRRLLPAFLLTGLLCGCTGTESGHVTFPAELGTVTQAVTETGLVVYDEDSAVTPVVSGKILSCLITEGDLVAAGQTLYLIDSADLEDQITRSALALASAQESYAQALAACEDLTVRSFVSGLVTAVYCNEGDFVATGTPIAQVVDSTALTLTLPFHTAESAAFTAGEGAVIQIEGTDEALSGTVARIYDAPIMTEGNRSATYVELSVSNPGGLTKENTAWAEVGGMRSIASASFAYAAEQSIYATQSGQVLSLPIQAGSSVTRDQAVMTIKNSALTNTVASAALACETAQVTLAQLEAKREDYIIRSPADGVIISRIQKDGDFAAAASPMSILARENAMKVEVDIDELYIEQIWPGQGAEISFITAAGEEKTYTAQVFRVNDTGTTSGGVTDYTVALQLDSTAGLKAGMNVHVTITVAHKADCLRVPTAALSGGSVRVLSGGAITERRVETGVSGGGYTEILSGLTAGELVVLS